jgi:hypothetical protein
VSRRNATWRALVGAREDAMCSLELHATPHARPQRVPRAFAASTRRGTARQRTAGDPGETRSWGRHHGRENSRPARGRHVRRATSRAARARQTGPAHAVCGRRGAGRLP